MCICSTCTHFASVRQFSAACFSLMKYAKLSSAIAIHQSGLRDFVFHDPNQRDSLLNRGTTLTLFSLAAQFVVGKGRLVDYREKNTSVMLCILSSYINMPVDILIYICIYILLQYTVSIIRDSTKISTLYFLATLYVESVCTCKLITVSY